MNNILDFLESTYRTAKPLKLKGCLVIKADLKFLPDISKGPEDTTHTPSRELQSLCQLGTEGTDKITE